MAGNPPWQPGRRSWVSLGSCATGQRSGLRGESQSPRAGRRPGAGAPAGFEVSDQGAHHAQCDGHLRLGVVFSQQELFFEASEQCKKATEYDEKNYDAWFRYASSLNSVENFLDASQAAQKCIDIKTKFGGGWYEKGVAEFGKGNKTRALKYFDEANKYRDWRKLAQRKIDEIYNPTKYEK